jgi:hypothetical protein
VRLCTYYRRFISGFAYIAKPLTRLTEAKRTFEWSTETDNFQALKDALCTAHVLCYPRSREKFIVNTDASYVGIGGVLLSQSALAWLKSVTMRKFWYVLEHST